MRLLVMVLLCCRLVATRGLWEPAGEYADGQ